MLSGQRHTSGRFGGTALDGVDDRLGQVVARFQREVDDPVDRPVGQDVVGEALGLRGGRAEVLNDLDDQGAEFGLGDRNLAAHAGRVKDFGRYILGEVVCDGQDFRWTRAVEQFVGET